MMGGGPRKDKKFIQKLMCQLRDGATELAVVYDKLGVPTYTRDFAHNVRLLLEKQWWGLYNMVCQGETSRLEVAQELVLQLGLTQEVKIRAVGSDYFADTYFAPRPDCERLTNRKLALRGLDAMRPWRDALAEYLHRDYEGIFPPVPLMTRGRLTIRVAAFGFRSIPSRPGCAGGDKCAEELFTRLAGRGFP